MGYLKDISSSEYAAKDVALMNRMQGVSNQSSVGYILATNAPQIFGIFGNLTMKALEKSDKSEGDSNDTDAVKREALENEKKDLLSALECESIDEFNGILNTLAGNITNLESSINTLSSSYNTKLENRNQTKDKLEAQYRAGEITEEEYAKADKEISDIDKELEQEKSDIEAKTQELQKLNKEYQDKQAKMQKVVDIQRKLDTLDNGGVKEKTSGMKEFTKALEKWQKAGNSDDKKALAEAAKKAFDDLQNNKDITVPQSVIKLYQLYDQDLNNDINGKREDLYQAS